VEGNIEEHVTASASRALRGLRALACAYTPCTGTGRSPDWPFWWSAQGRCNTDACDARSGAVRHQQSTEAPCEQSPSGAAGVGGGKGGDQGEQAATSHGPDAEPGARVPGVDAWTASQPWGHPRWSKAACRHIPKVGAGWGSASRPDLCRGCRVTGIPTAIHRRTRHRGRRQRRMPRVSGRVSSGEHVAAVLGHTDSHRRETYGHVAGASPGSPGSKPS